MVINCTVTSTTTLFMLNNFLRSHRPRPKDPHNKAKYDNLQNIFCFFRKFLKKALDKCPKTVYNIYCYLGVAQIGSALPWGGRGRRFKSCHSDQLNRLIIKIERFSFIFINFINKHSLLQYAMREALNFSYSLPLNCVISFITSPAIISPTTDGTNAVLPGTCLFPATLSALER